MFAQLMKWISIVALCLMVIGWRSAASYQLLLDVAVFMGAIVVMQQAARGKRYVWAGGFGAVAIFFNPVVPVAHSGALLLMMVIACIAPFAISLAAVKTPTLLSMPSITDRNPGSQSL